MENSNQVVTTKVKIDLDVQMTSLAEKTGSGFCGYFPDATKYKDLVAVFGRPNLEPSGDGKVKYQWVGFINGMPFRIYDYKSGAEAPGEVDSWHIGGRGKIATLVVAYFEAVKANNKARKAASSNCK